jgi:energy-coupling factor transporter ATP-binding protein EcfA2
MHQLKPPRVQGTEVNYELHSLGWKAFQNLCVTVTAEIWGQVVQSFSDSCDGGRDGAFHGTWLSGKGEPYAGAFTVQCKFTVKADKALKISDIKDELKKAKRLAARGMADNYFLFTNARLSGTTEGNMREAFELIPGIKRFAAFGSERISQIIRESPRLRMLVPRVYGLGDLSQILDERAYAQAQELLSALGDDLGKFVITDAYRRSAKALVEHGFVLLLGEPACGKSTIAAALAVGALDEWGCSTIKVRDADDFVKHSNPLEPKQFFWVDDAFGPNQFDWHSVVAWNRTFPQVDAAIRRGARVLFTSRDYIYKSARNHLKESALPVLKESQVVINVQDLTDQEREQILYNHVRLGTQPKEFKSQIKPYLPQVAIHPQFSPEIARRLGNPMFTKRLNVSASGLDDFVARPLELLLEIIHTLDAENRSALALVFMRNGVLPSPIDISTDERQAVVLLGGSEAGVRGALNALNGSLLILAHQNGRYTWRFKHPTIRDAFATLVAEDRELMDIYLAGSPLDKLFGEVSCGDVGIQGAKVIVPPDRYETIICDIESVDTTKQYNKSAVHRFLAYRCNKEFLELFIARNPQFIQSLSIGAYLYAVSDVDVIVRLNEFGLLPEPERLRAVNAIRELAVDVPDSGFLRAEIRTVLTPEELVHILQHVQTTLLPNLNETINQWRDGYSRDGDPDDHFGELKSALEEYRGELEQDEESMQLIDSALLRIGSVIEDLRSELPPKPDKSDFDGRSAEGGVQNFRRSVFDDVDL